MTDQRIPAQAENVTADAVEQESVRQSTGLISDRAEADLIRDTLLLCARTFGTERARFIRQLSAEEWQVHSLKNDTLFNHRADYAEVSMAWAVGLSRFPIRKTRPRITDLEGGGVRPIAVTTYFGIPVLCGDHLVGVIELAGNIGGDLLRTLETLAADLDRFGKRLTHDPSLRAPQFIDLQSECWIDGGCWASGEIDLSPDEWKLLSEIGAPEPVAAIAARVDFPDERVLELIRMLVGRGVVTVRASTRALAEFTESHAGQDCIAAGD